jgi:UDPglucose 6-dehydrogenase
MTETVSVIGLGKVGVTLCMALVQAGFKVVGVDVVPAIVKSLSDGSFTTTEPSVMEIYKKLQKGQFTATSDIAAAAKESSISFVIVPTPSNILGGFSNSCILESLANLGREVRKKNTSHTVSVISTCLPGSSVQQLIPAWEEAAGRKIGDKLGFTYNPSFIAQGEVMKGLITPDYILIGEADKASGDAVEAVCKKMLTNDAPVARMNTVEAEITKIASNTHETMRVAFANMLLGLCNELPGTDVDKITQALAFRLGRRFFKGAVPYGGPCWPRDNVALSAFMDLMNVPSTLPQSVDRSNNEHGRYILRTILNEAPKGSRIGVLGLAYKPGTWMTDRSYGIDLVNWLAAEHREVLCWDPMANETSKPLLHKNAKVVATAEECLKADAVVIALPLKLDSIDWKQAGNATILDCWRVLPESAQKLTKKYVALGKKPAETELWADDSEEQKRFELLTN